MKFKAGDRVRVVGEEWGRKDKNARLGQKGDVVAFYYLFSGTNPRVIVMFKDGEKSEFSEEDLVKDFSV